MASGKSARIVAANGDHDRPNALDAGVGQSAFQRFALLMHFLNEIEQHDHMADDDSDKAGYAKKRHESKRRMHDVQGDQSSHDAIRRCGKDQEWFDSVD